MDHTGTHTHTCACVHMARCIRTYISHTHTHTCACVCMARCRHTHKHVHTYMDHNTHAQTYGSVILHPSVCVVQMRKENLRPAPPPEQDLVSLSSASGTVCAVLFKTWFARMNFVSNGPHGHTQANIHVPVYIWPGVYIRMQPHSYIPHTQTCACVCMARCRHTQKHIHTYMDHNTHTHSLTRSLARSLTHPHSWTTYTPPVWNRCGSLFVCAVLVRKCYMSLSPCGGATLSYDVSSSLLRFPCPSLLVCANGTARFRGSVTLHPHVWSR